MDAKLKNCSVKGCYSREDGRRTFFAFPNLDSICQQWVEFCKDESMTELPRKRWVCDLHFKPEDFYPYYPLRRRRMAVPSLHGPQEIPEPLDSVEAPSVSQQNVETSVSSETTHQLFTCIPSTSGTSVMSSSIQTCRKRLPFSTPTSDQILAEPSTHAWIKFEHSYATKNSHEDVNSSHKSHSLSLHDISMTRLSQLSTPRKRYLYRYAKKKENEFKKLQKKFKKAKLTIQQLCDRNTSVAAAFESFSKQMSSASVIFLSSQLRLANKKSSGRRWTLEEKMLALSLFKRSPKAYTLMCSVFLLPNKRTLKRLLNKLPFNSGINSQMFATLSQKVNELKNYERTCTRIFDEMSIREHLQYNFSADRIDGFEDLGHKGRTSRTANHALVFMIRGLFRKWKQPVAYYFSHSSMRSETLVELILVILDACTSAGFNVVATVCDMGATNIKALKIMGSTGPEHPYFIHNSKCIFTILDPPHLIKCTRNLFMKYNVKCQVKTESLDFEGEAKWDDIIKAVEWDRKLAVCRNLCRVRNDHLQPKGKQKMKVSLAAQILSHSVAALINTLVAVNALEQSALPTAVFVDQCDRLFDSLNSYPLSGTEKELQSPLTSRSCHMAFWQEAFKYVNSWRFQKAGGISFRPPSQTGWLITINAVMQLWKSIKSQFENVQYLSVRCLNQDPLENVFGLVRAHCGSNCNPTVAQFVDALKACIVNELAFRELRKTNCVEDNACFLSDLRTFLGLNTTHDNSDTSIPFAADSIDTTCYKEPDIPSDMTRLSTAYVSGFIARKLLANNTCNDCRAGLCTEKSDELFNMGIEFKEYTDGKQRLTYPSENLVICVVQCATLVDEILDKGAHHDRLAEVVMCAIKQRVNFKWLADCCAVHYILVLNKFTEYIIHICIPWWCKRQNHYIAELSRRK